MKGWDCFVLLVTDNLLGKQTGPTQICTYKLSPVQFPSQVLAAFARHSTLYKQKVKTKIRSYH